MCKNYLYAQIGPTGFNVNCVYILSVKLDGAGCRERGEGDILIIYIICEDTTFVNWASDL